MALVGKNFSGRTQKLLAAIADRKDGIYLGPEASTWLTGLALSVAEELCWGRSSVGKNDCALISNLGLQHLLDRNPLSLSGGEQALVALTGALIARPSLLAVDCLFEQFSMHNRQRILDNLIRSPNDEMRTLYADNRLDEYAHGFVRTERCAPADYNSDVMWQLNDIDGTLDQDTVPMPCRVRLEGIVFSYKTGRRVLNEISLNLEPGNIYTLRGNNGAGKTTLSKLLAGLLRPSVGVILIDQISRKLWSKPGSVFSYHFQNPDLQLFSTSVLTELTLGTKCFLSSRERTAHIDKLIQTFGLQGVIHEHPLDLPFVIRKRVAMAATFSTRRPWVILDEPTLGQDNDNCASLVSFITKCAKAGQGIIIITHSERFADAFSSKTITLENGRAQFVN
ncbi:MAG: ATP-binding cassette domain-containing protein [Sulfobacillus sp.]